MAANDLTTLVNVKQYLSLTGPEDDALLSRLITAASAFIQSHLNRTFASQSYTEKRNGNGGQRLSFSNFPVTAVSSVAVDGVAIPAAADATKAGYIFSSTMLFLNGWSFTRGYQNVAIAYTAGYVAVPADIEQVCIDLVSLKYRERDRIGISSKTLGGETVNYVKSDLSDEVKNTLRQYQKVITQ